MSIKKTNKLNPMSVVALLTVALAVTLTLSATMITTNASVNTGSTLANPTKTPPGGRKAPSGNRKPETDGSQRVSNPGNTSANAFASSPLGDRTSGNTSVAANSNSVPKPTGKNLSSKQKTNVTELVKDLQDIKSGSTVTQDQVKTLANSLMTLAQGTTKPNPATVDKLAADLADVISDGGVSNSDIKLICDDLKEVMNSANIPQSEVDAAIQNAQAIFIASGVNKGDALEVQADLEAIAKELKKNVGNAKQNMPTVPSGAKRQRP